MCLSYSVSQGENAHRLGLACNNWYGDQLMVQVSGRAGSFKLEYRSTSREVIHCIKMRGDLLFREIL
jgi:hypothetical protein